MPYMDPMGYFHAYFHGCFPERLRSRALLFMTDSANFHLANATEFSHVFAKNPPFFFHGIQLSCWAGTVVDPGYEDCQFRRARQGELSSETVGWTPEAFRSGQVLILQILHSHKTAPALGNLSSLRHPRIATETHQTVILPTKKIIKSGWPYLRKSLRNHVTSPQKRIKKGGNILQQHRSLPEPSLKRLQRGLHRCLRSPFQATRPPSRRQDVQQKEGGG